LTDTKKTHTNTFSWSCRFLRYWGRFYCQLYPCFLLSSVIRRTCWCFNQSTTRSVRARSTASLTIQLSAKQ